MKKKILLFAGVAALLFGSCIEDKGNYDYSMTEEPRVTIMKRYMAFTDLATDKRGNLTIDPALIYEGDRSKLTFIYEFFDKTGLGEPVLTMRGDENGVLDDPMDDLPDGTYQVKLTIIVPDDSDITVDKKNGGMKYYYNFSILMGGTLYTTGSAVLVNDGGVARLHFIQPPLSSDDEPVVYEDVYGTANGGAEIPGTPLQLLSPMSFMGAFSEMYYYILTDNSGTTDGAIVGVEDMKKTTDNFYASLFPGGVMLPMSPPDPAPQPNPGVLLPMVYSTDSFTFGKAASNYWCQIGFWAFVMNNNLYAYAGFQTMPTVPDKIIFGPGTAWSPIDQNISYITNDRRFSIAGNMWGWDMSDKRMVMYGCGPGGIIAASPQAPDDTFKPASMASEEWDPRNVGADLVTMQFYNGGGWLIVDQGGTIYQLGFSLSDTNTEPEFSNLTKKVFAYSGLLTPQTKWLIDVEFGTLYFSSGSSVYRYEPSTPSVAPVELPASLDGDVSMLRFRTYREGDDDATHYTTGVDRLMLEVGTEGHLYWIDLNVGTRGQILRDVPMSGAPVDIWNRMLDPLATVN